MSVKPIPSPAARPFRKRYSPATILTCTGLLSAGVIGFGGFCSLQASRSAQTAALLTQIGRQELWLHGAAKSRPRKEWQPVLTTLEGDWSKLAATAPIAAKSLGDQWRVVDRSFQSQGSLKWTAADRFSENTDTQAAGFNWTARQCRARADTLTAAGAGGLFLCLLGSLGLGRRQRLTQFQTTQGYLASERTAWEKQRSAFDAQRDQLIAELQQAQQHKAELDTLRRNGSQQFEEFFRTLPTACFCVAASGKIVRWNSACETLYGYAAADVLDKSIWETIVPSGERARVAAQFERVLTGESLSEIDRHDRHADGSFKDVRCSLAPLRDAAGQIIGTLSANLALAEVRPYEQRIETQEASLQQMQSLLQAQQEEFKALQAQQKAVASLPEPAPEAAIPAPEARELRDPITGLHTHGDFQEHVRLEFDRMARYNTPSALVMIDLDHFGQYNETFGYPAGNQALRDVAEMLNTKVRSVDVVARYGADELAVLLPETSRAGAMIAAERFRSGIAGIAWDGRPLTASVSVVVLTPDIDHPRTLIARAVAALRVSTGTNRLVCADDVSAMEARKEHQR